jgi:hypothetical protein
MTKQAAQQTNLWGVNFGRRSPGLGGQYCRPNDKVGSERANQERNAYDRGVLVDARRSVPDLGNLDQADQRCANAYHCPRYRQDMRSEAFASRSDTHSIGHDALGLLGLVSAAISRSLFHC